MKTEVGDRDGDFRVASRASQVRVFARYWLPVLLWMMLIFGFSTGAGSTTHTSRIIRPLLRWLIPNVTDATMDRVQFIIRKGGHMTEYAVLAFLLWRARRQTGKQSASPWRWSEAAFALAIAVLFAASDELHQAFVPSREARVGDVLLDATGAATALLALYAFGRWRRKW